MQTVFETLQQNSTNLDIFVNYGPCFPTLAGFGGNYPYPGRHASNITEYVCVVTNSAPVPLTNGDWFVAVRRQGTPAVGTILDVSGRRVATVLGRGGASLRWDGMRSDGSPAGPGVYLYHIESGGTKRCCAP